MNLFFSIMVQSDLVAASLLVASLPGGKVMVNPHNRPLYINAGYSSLVIPF